MQFISSLAPGERSSARAKFIEIFLTIKEMVVGLDDGAYGHESVILSNICPPQMET